MMPSVYQIVQFRGGHARLVEEHAAVLEEEARELFGRSPKLVLTDIRKAMERVVEREKYADAETAYLVLRAFEDGHTEITAGGRSMYEGYALRTIHPRAITLAYSLPLGDLPTPARDATVRETRCMARARRADVAVRCTAEGRCRSCEGHPIGAIYHNRLILPKFRRHVERDLLRRAADLIGLEVVEMAFNERQAGLLEEIFWVDHRGITALGSINSAPLMALTVERLSEGMEELASL